MNTLPLGRANAMDTGSTGCTEPLPTLEPDAQDTIEQMARADHADWVLLRLVLCAAGATLLLALASCLGL
jgi:hypothetical protein